MLPVQSRFVQFLPPVKHASRKITTATTRIRNSTKIFILQFCHHIWRRSWRPFFWNVSACAHAQTVPV